jgi:hypothetical protein
MRRSRYGGFRAPRTKKIRNPIRVKERVAKKGGRCAACRSRYEKGDEITVVNIRRRTYHRHGCVPMNVGVMPTAGPMAVANTPEAVVKALASNWSVGEAKLVAIMALENAMVVVAKNTPVTTPEMEKSFDRFMKVKAMALRPGSDQEGKQATRLSLIEIIKTFF